ncbi:MAG: hypothetical protein D6812_10635 [Deltaproteobacteria bacterium]|nr:MAG: hypothetical protein D6812_10635 [Deltaproteobacteria bacterium]
MRGANGITEVPGMASEPLRSIRSCMEGLGMTNGTTGKNDRRSAKVDETPLPGARTRDTDPYVRRKARRYVSQFERYRSKLHQVMDGGGQDTPEQKAGTSPIRPTDSPPSSGEIPPPPSPDVPHRGSEEAKRTLSRTCSVCGRPILPNRDNACAEHLSFARMQAQLRRKKEEGEREEEAFAESFEIRPKPRNPAPKPQAPLATPFRRGGSARRTPPESTFWESVLALREDRKKAVGYTLIGLATLLVLVKAILLWIRFFTL